MTNINMDFNLEDIANFITYNDSGDREGYGIEEFGNLISDTAQELVTDDESPEWNKTYDAIYCVAKNAFKQGMQAGAQLQVQLLTGGGSHA